MRIRLHEGRCWKLLTGVIGSTALLTACGHSPGDPGPRAPALTSLRAVVHGTAEEVVAGDSAKVLYYSTTDTPAAVVCTGVCTQTWVPFLKPVAPLLAPPYPNGPSGMLTWVRGADGCQAEYNGHPVYTYSGDVRAGEVSGDGAHAQWFVVTPDLAAAAGWGASTARSSC